MDQKIRSFFLNLLFFYFYASIEKKAHNSVGRVIALQAIGHRFKSGWA
jgi:hypothetical protein